jgi:cell wall-associated NlpC family hydrolase
MKRLLSSDQIAKEIILPSGKVTAEDYDFWSPTLGHSTREQRKQRAAELNAILEIDASPTMYFLVARNLRKGLDKAEAEARGIKTEERDPETGKVIAVYLWEFALRHVRAVEAAAAMSEEDYIKTERQPGTGKRWPRWYRDSNKKRAYNNLVAESKTDYYGKKES